MEGGGTGEGKRKTLGELIGTFSAMAGSLITIGSIVYSVNMLRNPYKDNADVVLYNTSSEDRQRLRKSDEVINYLDWNKSVEDIRDIGLLLGITTICLSERYLSRNRRSSV